MDNMAALYEVREGFRKRKRSWSSDSDELKNEAAKGRVLNWNGSKGYRQA